MTTTTTADTTCVFCDSPILDGPNGQKPPLLAGRAVCAECASGAEPPKGIMPPNERERAAIAAWLQPRGARS